MHGLLRRSALPVDGGSRYFVGHPGDQPARARDVTGLGADGVDATEHDVVDCGRIDVDAIEQGTDGMCAEIGGVNVREPPLRLPTGVRTASTM